jgi:hypothetical protein
MILTGKFLGEHNSAFVEFEIDELIEGATFDEIKEKASCYEAIWQGKSDTFKNGISLMMGFDYCESSDIELLKEHLSSESFEILEEMYEDS